MSEIESSGESSVMELEPEEFKNDLFGLTDIEVTAEQKIENQLD